LTHAYIREAHPTDGWSLESNAESEATCLRRPRTVDERRANAERARTMFPAAFVVADRCVVDKMDDEMELAYEARPERLYVIRQGKIAYRSGPGPFQYSTKKLAEFLAEAK
jgi:type I thyroxine 5'-deiodinase